jgi:hypothetical protein
MHMQLYHYKFIYIHIIWWGFSIEFNLKRDYSILILKFELVRKDMDIKECQRLYNSTFRNKLISGLFLAIQVRNICKYSPSLIVKCRTAIKELILYF